MEKIIINDKEVLIGNKKMRTKKFFSKLEKNFSNGKWSIIEKYNDSSIARFSEFYLVKKGKEYKIEIDECENEEKYERQLEILARLEDAIEMPEKDNFYDLSPKELEYCIRLIEKNCFSFKKYMSDLGSDVFNIVNLNLKGDGFRKLIIFNLSWFGIATLMLVSPPHLDPQMIMFVYFGFPAYQLGTLGLISIPFIIIKREYLSYDRETKKFMLKLLISNLKKQIDKQNDVNLSEFINTREKEEEKSTDEFKKQIEEVDEIIHEEKQLSGKEELLNELRAFSTRYKGKINKENIINTNIEEEIPFVKKI